MILKFECIGVLLKLCVVVKEIFEQLLEILPLMLFFGIF